MNRKLKKKTRRFEKECQKDFPVNSRGESLYTVLYAGFDKLFEETFHDHNRQTEDEQE